MSILAGRGLSLDEAISAVRDQAVAEMQASGADTGIWTEVGRRQVMVGVAMRGRGAFTLLVDRDQYDGRALLDWALRAAPVEAAHA